MEELAKVLINKLSKEELNKLCTSFDDGTINELFYVFLTPQDIINYPEQYGCLMDDRLMDDSIKEE